MTVQPLRRVFKIVNGGTPTSERENWDGDVAWATPVDLGRLNGSRISKTQRTLTAEGLRTGSSLVPAGSLIVSTRAPIGYVAETTTPMALNQGCRGLVPRTELDVRFFRYQLLVSEGQLQARGQGSTFVELSTDALACFPLVVPPLATQRAIADYLDAETAKLDQIVKCLAQANLLLDEWLETEIETTIWSGDGTDMPLMHLTPGDRQIQYGIVLPGPDVPNGVRIVKGGNIVTGHLNAAGLARTTHEIEAGFVRSRLRRNDIVFAIRGAVGACAMVPEEVEGANITQDVARVSPLPGLEPSWLLYALTSRTLQRQVESRVVGATIRGVNIRDLKRVRVPVPTPVAQRRKAEALGESQAHRDHVWARRQRQIDLLMERRQALITAAVTGQLEIPGVAA